MSRSPKLALYAFLAALSFTCALALGRPELAGLGAPFALVLIVGLSLPPPPDPGVALRLERERALEGEEIESEIVFERPGWAYEVVLTPTASRGVSLAETDALVLRIEPRRERAVPVRLLCDHWGLQRVGGFDLRTSDAARLRFFESRRAPERVLRVYPRRERLLRLIAPLETQPFAGNRVARAKAEGIEFADVRPYVPGDRVRRLNWRASSRNQMPYVNQQHPERNSDVVIFLDSFTAVEGESEGTLDLAVRAASALANHYLTTQDRVGIVGFGGIVRWLTPASGTLQAYRIAESLLETEIIFSHVWKGIDVLPPRSLTPQALVIGLSPLLDERGFHALLDLRRRNFDLVVIDLSPLAFVDSGQARRLWRLWRETLHFRCAQLGVAIAEWDGSRPLAEAVEEVRAFQRFARHTYA